MLITPRYPQNDLLSVAHALGVHLQVFQRTGSKSLICSTFFFTRYNQTPPPTQAYSSLGSSSQSALMRNSVVNSVGRNLEVSPAQVSDLLYIGHFFQHDVSNTRFSCVGQSSEVTVCFQSPQGQLQQFPLQKSPTHYFSGAPTYGKMVNLGFPFPQPMFNSWIDSPIKL